MSDSPESKIKTYVLYVLKVGMDTALKGLWGVVFVSLLSPLLILWAFLKGVRSPWLYLVAGSVFSFLVIAITLAILGYRKMRQGQVLEVAAKAGEQLPEGDVKMISAAEVEPLKDRMKELEASNAQAAKDVDRFREDAERSNEHAQAHAVRASHKQGLLDKYRWVHAIAEKERIEIHKHVLQRLSLAYSGQVGFP